jgi:hypothetical protein
MMDGKAPERQLSLLAAVQADALWAVIDEDPEWEVRQVLRWYSRTFHTPLHEVEELPPEDVFRAWFESRYEQMEHGELIDHARLVIETPEERAERIQREAEREDEDLAFLESALKADAAKEAKRKARKKLVTKLPDPKAPPKVASVPTDKEALPPIKVVFSDEPLDLDRDGLEPV